MLTACCRALYKDEGLTDKKEMGWKSFDVGGMGGARRCQATSGG
jgi:hypothetical protein